LDELFEIFDANGTPRGLAARPRVHSLGLWHKSAHVFLFDLTGNLYLQLRAPDKDLYPGLWDYSVGEHLQPGESFHAGAVRGLREELGVDSIALQALGAVRTSSFDIPEFDLHDRELQQAFRGVYDGAIAADPVEVAEVRCLPLAELEGWIARAPADFTPWFVRDLRELGMLSAAGT
jgi:isopentenyldiphosphate isomerase